MHGITNHTRKRLKDPREAVCAFWKQNNCKGRITVSHPIRFASKQIHEPWAEVLACAHHAGVLLYQDTGGYDEAAHQYYALNQATNEELKKYSKVVDLVALRATLAEKYD